jgi:tetratricopeptide (TPR) repeat protein
MTTATVQEGQNLNFAIPASEILRVLNGPQNRREVWDGASIQETENAAFEAAREAFYRACEYPDWVAEFFVEHPAGEAARQILIDSMESDELRRAEEECLNTKTRQGDQLALLLEGWRMYNEIPMNSQHAVTSLRRATTAKPGNFAYLAHYALALALREQIPQASHTAPEGGIAWEVWAPVLDALKRAKELKRDFAPTFYWLAEMYRMGLKWPEMLLEAEALVKLMPRCWQAYQLRGFAWAALGRAEPFERDFEEAVELSPNNMALLAVQCSGYLELEAHEKAVEKCKEAIAVGPCSGRWEQRNLHCWTTYYNLGLAYERLGDYSEASTSYQATLKHPTDSRDIFVQDLQQRIAECRRRLNQLP